MIRCAPEPVLEDLARLLEQSGEEEEMPFRLIGRRHVRSNNSWMHNYQRLVKGKGRCQLMMHPDDVASLGLKDGQLVRVSSRVGEVVAELECTDDMMPGVVSLPHGWGHGRKGVQAQIAQAHAGVSVNDLTDDQFLDELSGNAALNGVPVAVVAAG
jgi:anaerobic selenocysteine-containing dehydrogenase